MCAAPPPLDALQDSDAVLRAMFDVAALGVALIDSEGRFVQVNEFLVRWLGRSREELIGQRINRITHPDDLATTALLLGRLMDADIPSVEVEKRYVRANGAYVWGRVHAARVDLRGRAHAVAVITDVTERREAEARAAAAQRRQEALLLTLPDAAWFKDRDGRYLAVNEAFARSVGVPRESVIGMRSEDFAIFDQQRAQIRASDEEVMRFERPVRTEERIVRPGGEECWYETLRVPYRDASGRVEGTVGIARDVTDRRRAQEALTRSEQHFRTLTENAQEVMCILGSDGRLSYISASVQSVLGYAPDELPGLFFHELLHPDDLSDALEDFSRVIGLPETWVPLSMRARHRDGSYRILEGGAKNLLGDPIVNGIIANVRDVTAKRDAERALRESEHRLQQAQRIDAVGRLAGGIAHDFNNLLTAIISYTDLLANELGEAHPLRGDVAEIRRAGERAAGLTRQLLAFTRQQVMTSEPLDLGAATTEMRPMLRRLIREDIEIELQLPPEPVVVSGDRSQLEQVIMNLALNARDAMPDGGRLRLRVGRARLGAAFAATHPGSAVGEYAMLQVVDDGVGMTADVRARAFEPFFTTKAPGQGTGLGLSTVYGIVKQSGGYIDVESQPETGTRVTIFLPLLPAPDNAQPAAPPAPSDVRGRETVLLVEDEASVRAVARRTLTRHGYTVLEAADGEEALAVCATHDGPVHLLLTDMVMPRMSGRELAERMNEQLPPDVRPPHVIFMSGYTEDAIIRRGDFPAGTSFLAKPFTMTGLVEKVRAVLSEGA